MKRDIGHGKGALKVVLHCMSIYHETTYSAERNYTMSTIVTIVFKFKNSKNMLSNLKI